MCKLGYCCYEDDITMPCDECPHNEKWAESDFDALDDFEDDDDEVMGACMPHTMRQQKEVNEKCC